MKFKIINIPQVTEDLQLILDFYTEISPKLPKQLIKQLRFGVNQILKSPYGYQIKYKNVRTLLIYKFPYHIHYYIVEKLTQILVLAVIHSYRKPQDYSKRTV
jgi:plasmid stabilization system protein ParE